VPPELIRPITVVAYFLAASLCGVNIFLSDTSLRGTWIGITLLLTFLGISKQWNIVPNWALAIRDAAWIQGWYELRRIFQTILIGVFSLFLLTWFLAVLRNSPWQLWFPISLTSALVALTIIRAVSLHAIDLFLYQDLLPGIQPNMLIEVGGILFLILSAILSFFFPKLTESEKA
jgi:hypothetical protein